VGELEGRVAIVTGSTRGIGRAIASRFCEAGARVVVHGRDQATAERIAGDLAGEAIGVAAPMDDSDAVRRLVDHTVRRWGRVDVLVNNAGVALDGFVTRIDDERWHETLETNLSGAFWAVRSVVPVMKEQSAGSIVNVVSWAGLRGNVGQAAYSASKAGLYGLTLSLAKELGKFGIRVNALSPAVPTDMSEEMPEHLRKESLRRTPLHRRGTLGEVAEGALFLASDRSSFTTGLILHVDGGLHLS
jgi:NAD(P)-dependent dehydrogenase (short-subunit alcohol dehydrogenase family)